MKKNNRTSFLTVKTLAVLACALGFVGSNLAMAQITYQGGQSMPAYGQVGYGTYPVAQTAPVSYQTTYQGGQSMPAIETAGYGGYAVAQTSPVLYQTIYQSGQSMPAYGTLGYR